MTREEIATMIESIGVPFAYYQFSKATAKPCPFICFYYQGSADEGADNINYVHVDRLIIELYTDNKDFQLEDRVGEVLNSHGLFYNREEAYIDTERMYEVIYESEVIING